MTRIHAARGHLVVLLVQLTALALTVWWLRAPPPGAVVVLPPPTALTGPTPSAVPIMVYVSGAVARAGVVRLTAGARAADAVAAAGGLAAGADPAAVNLAVPLADGDQLHVPAPGGALAGPDTGPGAGPSRANASGATSPQAGATSNRLDLNRASAAELEALPGIGPALAARILDYRAAHGRFGEVRELLKVAGVGEKTLARFADQLVVR